MTAPVSANRPLRADAARNRARILEAAESVLATGGLSAPIDDIARAADVGIGTVYRHFPTKEALFDAIVVGRLQRLVDEAEARANDDDPGATFFEMFSMCVEHGTRHKALVEALTNDGFNVVAATDEVKHHLRDAIEVLLVRAQQSRSVRDDVHIEDVMSLLAGACHASAYSGYDPARRARTVAIMSDGLRPSSRRIGTRIRSAASRRNA
jgi:AcrR family transcriptional regulator